MDVNRIPRMLNRWKRFNRRLYRNFKQLVSPRERNSIRSLFRLFQTATVAVVSVFAINLIPAKGKGFGEWGDFFGGVLNPLLTFLTFMGLLITIIIQQTELRESRTELKRSADALRQQSNYQRKQNFESTYFQMIRTHQELVNSIDLVDDSGNVTRGRDCFRVFYTRFTKIYRKKKANAAGNYVEEKLLESAFAKFWNDHQLELGHYFRYLASVLNFIEVESDFDGLYLDNLEALLSDQELLMIFYYSVCEQSHGSALRKLVEAKSLLQNTPIVRLLDSTHINLIGQSAFGSRSDV